MGLNKLGPFGFEKVYPNLYSPPSVQTHSDLDYFLFLHDSADKKSVYSQSRFKESYLSFLYSRAGKDNWIFTLAQLCDSEWIVYRLEVGKDLEVWKIVDVNLLQ